MSDGETAHLTPLEDHQEDSMSEPFVASNGDRFTPGSNGEGVYFEVAGMWGHMYAFSRKSVQAFISYAEYAEIGADYAYTKRIEERARVAQQRADKLSAQVEAARGMALTLRSNVNTRQAGVDMLYAIEGATDATEGELDAERFEVALDHIEKAKQAMYHAREAGS